MPHPPRFRTPRQLARRPLGSPRWRPPRSPVDPWPWADSPPPSLWTIRPDYARILSALAGVVAERVGRWRAGGPGVEPGTPDAVALEGTLGALLSHARAPGNSSAAGRSARDACDYARACLTGVTPVAGVRCLGPDRRDVFARRALGELAALRLACRTGDSARRADPAPAGVA